MTEPTPTLWPLVLYAAAVVAVVAGMVGLASVLGERHHEHATGEIYESGILTTGDARARVSPRFYLIAMLFVIFDLEAVFVYAWAVSVRETGWTGWVEVTVFIAVLGGALLYLWRDGALDLAPAGVSRRRKAQRP